MPTGRLTEDQTTPFWAMLLDCMARQLTLDVLGGCPEGDFRRYAAEFVMATALDATRPESEVPTLGTATLEDGSTVACTTPPGYLRRAFAGRVDDWTDPATAAWILDVVRAAVAAELQLDPIGLVWNSRTNGPVD